MTLDFDLRLRAHALGEWVAAEPSFTPLEVVPGIRSLQVQFDPVEHTPDAVVELLARAEESCRPSTTWSSTVASCTSRSRGTIPRRVRRSDT